MALAVKSMLHCNRTRRSSCAIGAAFAATLALAAFAQSAHAANVIYDNNAGGAAGINGAILSDLDNSAVGLFRINADDVTLVADATIAGIEWSGVYGQDQTPPATDNFTIEVFADNVGVGIPLAGPPMHSFNVGNAVSRTDSGFDRPNGADIFNYSAPINFVLPANTTVWVAIFDNTAGENDDFFWAMLWPPPPGEPQGNCAFSSNEGSSWNPTPYRQDFRLLAGDATSVVTFENLVIDRLDLAGPQSEGGFTYEAVSGEGWELVDEFGNPPSSLATFFTSEGPKSVVGDTVEIHADGELFTFNSVDYRSLVGGIPGVVQISGFRDGAFIDVLPLNNPSTIAFETKASLTNEAIDTLRVSVTTNNSAAVFLDNFALVLSSCLADLSGDGQVGFTDLTELLSQWGPCPGCGADLDDSGTVGFTDLTELLAAWGACL